MAALSNYDHNPLPCACGRAKEKVNEKTCNDCMDLWGILDKCALEDGKAEVSVFGVCPFSLKEFHPRPSGKVWLGAGAGAANKLLN